MPWNLRLGTGAVLLALLTGGGAAQTPQMPSAPVFRGGTTLVPLDVRVLDKQGRPVTNLMPGDFAVIEDGAPQRIAHFERQNLAADAAAATALLERRTSQTVETAPRTFRVFLIYLGRGDLSGPSRGIDGVIHLVRDLLLPQDRIAILAWNRATDFTADHASALAVLDRFKDANLKVERELFDHFSGLAGVYGDHRIPPSIQRDIDAVFQGANKAPMRSAIAELQSSRNSRSASAKRTTSLTHQARTRSARRDASCSAWTWRPSSVTPSRRSRTKGTSTRASSYMRHLEGEKHLVWLTEYGLRRSLLTPTELDRDLARRAADARVVMNIIRAGGAEYSHGQPGAAESRRPVPVVGIQATNLLLPAAVSRTLADLTGGRSDANRFNGSQASDYIEQASRFQYLLGYSPTNTRWDGRFRRVVVTVNRPGAIVLVRSGYYAREEVGPLDRQSVVTFGRLAAAAGDAGEIPDLGLHATSAQAPSGPVTLQISFDVSRVAFKRMGGQNVASLEVGVFCLDKRQRPVGDLRQTLALSFTDDRLAEVRQTGIPVTLVVPATGPADSLKLVAYDYASDLTGSLNVKVSH